MTAVSASVLTSETTTSTSYTDLTTTTDSVSATVGASGSVLVCMAATIANSTIYTYSYASYGISGGNTRAVDDDHCIILAQQSFGGLAAGACFLETGLSAGSATFKMKYKVSANTGTFSNRSIAVIPLEDLTNAAAGTAYVSTSESTSSTSYADLTTTTDSATVTIGPTGLALVLTVSGFSSGTTGQTQYASYALSGATTRSADDDHAISNYMQNFTSQQYGGVFLETGLAAGSTTFKLKYRGTSGTNSFYSRRIAVIPL